MTKWIASGEGEIVGLSLAVLVNLCYKNLPAIYTLMRAVDCKPFLRTILQLDNHNITIRVQVKIILYIIPKVIPLQKKKCLNQALNTEALTN